MPKELDITPSERLRLNARGYKVTKKLEVGAYAAVYLVEHKHAKTGKTTLLACKIMDTARLEQEFVQKFLPRELAFLQSLDHPHIIQVQNIFHRKFKYFVFMRYAENGDLLEFILRKGAVSEAQARVWFRQITLAVQYLHVMDVAHRDLKCENILITANYNLKLADFGFARYVVDEHGKKLTSDTYCGSLSYVPPEILFGSPYYPKIADCWSLGVILYVMLNKALPFDEENVDRLYDCQVNRLWKLRKKTEKTLSDECKILLEKLMEPDIKRRWTVDNILTSPWMSMDKRLLQLTSSEAAALQAAFVIKQKASNISKPPRLPDVVSMHVDSMVHMGTRTTEKERLREIAVSVVRQVMADIMSTVIPNKV